MVFIILCEFTNLERPKSDTFIRVSRLTLDNKIFSGYKRKHTLSSYEETMGT